MTAKTDEQKAADEAAKEQEAKQKAAEANLEQEAEDARLAQASRSSAEAQAAAEADLREQLRNELREEITKEAQGEGDSFGGQHLSSDNFSIVTTETAGRPGVEIRPAGWVGPGFEIAPSRVKELRDLLGKVKHLPKD